MEYPALLKPKGFCQGSTIIWEVKSFEGLSAQVKKRKLLNLQVPKPGMIINLVIWNLISIKKICNCRDEVSVRVVRYHLKRMTIWIGKIIFASQAVKSLLV